MRPLAERTARRIRDRTRRGRDVRGRPFARMADGSRADLRDSGKMVDSFRPVAISDRGFVLAPAGRKEIRKAILHQLGKRRPKRQWVGVTHDEIDSDLDNLITEWMGRR